MQIRLYWKMAIKRIILALWIGACAGFAQGQAPGIMGPQVYNFTSFSEKHNSRSAEMESLTDPALRSHPEYGVLPYNAPCEDCFELLEKRTEQGRYFVDNGTGGGRFHVQKSYGNIHYKDAAGRLITIDPQLYPTAEPGVYAASQQPVPTRLDLNAGYASIFSKGLELKLNQGTRLFHDAGGNLYSFPAPDASQTSVGRDGAKSRELWPGMDREQIFLEGRIKTNYLLTRAPQLQSGEGWLVFEDQWQLPAGFTLVRDDHGLVSREGWWLGELIVKNGMGEEVLRVRSPKLYDENPDLAAKAAGMDPTQPIIGYEVIDRGNGNYTFRTRVSVPWILRPERVFPITVDPLVTGTATYSLGDMGFTYDASCWNAGIYCAFPLLVNVPGNSQLTGCTFSGAYTSEVGGCGPLGDCLRSNAAFRIYGPCGFSPGGNNYWTCPGATTPGNCTGTALQAPALVTCIPAQCAPYNLNFEMRLFHCNCITGACDVSCHRMPNNSWIMNVSGQTVAFTNPVAPINASSTTICLGNTVTLTSSGSYGVAPLTYTWSLNNTFVPPLANGFSTVVTPSAAGPTTYYLQLTDACGQSVTSQININVVAPPTLANAGPDQTVCSSTATLGGNTLTAGTGTWTVISGGATVTTPSNPTSGVTNLGPGANVFQWTTTNPPCPQTQDLVTITRVLPPTPANAGANLNVCGNSTVFGATPATTGSGVWSYFSGPGGSTIVTPSSATSGLNNLNQGTYQFVWTTSNAPCPISTDTVLVTVAFQPPAATAGSDQIICADNVTLAANAASPGTGTWTYVSGPAGSTITSPNAENSTVTGLVPGTYLFEWSIANAPCPASNDQVSVTVVADPTPSNAGPDQEVCGTSTTLAGNVAVIGTGAWTQSSGPNAAVIANGADPFTGLSGLVPGVYVFDWTISNAPCNSTTSSVQVTVSEPPTVADAGPDQSLCGAPFITLAGNAATVGTGTWTVLSGGGSLTNANDPNTTVTGANPGISVFVWTIENGVCPPTMDTVVVSLFDQPVADFTADSVQGCTSFTVSFINNSTGATTSWDFGDGGTATSNGTEGIAYAYQTPGIYDVTIITSNGNCADTMTLSGFISVGQVPTVNFVANPTIPGEIEEGNSVDFTNLSSGATSYVWDFGDGDTSHAVNPTHVYDSVGAYCVTLMAWDSLGCMGSVTQCTLYVESGGFTIGNVFTPNGDGINDFFGAITTNSFRTFSLKIFDRWGHEIWEGSSVTDKWNGTQNGNEAPEGVYYFSVIGFRPDGELVEVTGNVTLVR